jgi:4-amino-4-deoxy-L-arabinose transferase-like glycosyltransferase
VREGLSRPLWLAVIPAGILVAFALPLFIGLGARDLENDEAIYSYAVDSILASGDWLSPVLSPFESTRFLEKPPLKFWIVAAPIALGWLPHDEWGFRAWDALFGAIAFLYVFALGRRLAGPACGLVAVFALFVYRPLLFEHGLRDNAMEGPLFLAYCGGAYHYLAWASPERQPRAVAHASAVMLYFVLGFMTKFVASVFLPMVLVATTLSHRQTLRKAVAEWRLWCVLGLASLVLIAPWFVYQYRLEGAGLFHVMFAEHVYARFTASLDPGHLHPWSFYYLTMFRQLGYSGTTWLAVTGAIILLVNTVRQPSLDKLLVVYWFVIPVALISTGTSKLHHYLYPFLPPVALAAGYGPAWLLAATRSPVDQAMAAVHRRWIAARRWTPAVVNALLALAVIAAFTGALTLVLGRIDIDVAEVTVFRNSSVARPLVIALLLATLAGQGVAAARALLPAILLVALLPINEYWNTIRELPQEHHPMRTTSACLARVRASELAAGRTAPGVYAIGGERWFLHSYFYYLRKVGGWEDGPADERTLEQGLFEPGRQRPIMIGDAEYGQLRQRRGDALHDVPALKLREVFLLMPGPYAVCAPTPGPRSGG